jgi:hypothetical protein
VRTDLGSRSEADAGAFAAAHGPSVRQELLDEWPGPEEEPLRREPPSESAVAAVRASSWAAWELEQQRERNRALFRAWQELRRYADAHWRRTCPAEAREHDERLAAARARSGGWL